VLLTGDFPELEHAFVERVRTLRRDDPLRPLLVLVPTNLLRVHLRRTLATRGDPHINLRLMTFAEWIRELTTPVTVTQKLAALPPLADQLLIAQAFAACGERSYFGSLRDRPGLHRAMLRTITDLKEACITPAGLDEAASRIRNLHATVQARHQGLWSVWTRYEELKAKHRFVDDADRHMLAAEQIDSDSLVRQTAELIVYGIYDLKGIQAHLIVRAAATLPTTVFFPYEPQPAWEYAAPSRQMLLDAGFVETALATRPTDRCAELDRLCRRLFAKHEPGETRPTIGPIDPIGPMNNVTIVSAPGETSEAAEIARIMFDLAKRDGVAFGDVAVLLRAPGASLNDVRGAIEQAAITPYCPNGLPLNETRAGRSFALLLHILHDRLSRRAVMDFLTFADIDFPTLVGTHDPPTALWDAISMRANIVRGRDQWLGRLAALHRRAIAARDNPAYRGTGAGRLDPEVVGGFLKIVETVFDHLELLQRSQSWGDLVGRAVAAFQSLIRPSGDRDRVVQSIAQLAALECVQKDADQGLFDRLAAEQLASDGVPADRSLGDGPTVVGLMHARGVPFRAVIVPGLVERSFPQQPSLDPILLDHERRMLNESLRSIFPVRTPAAKSTARSDTDVLRRLTAITPAVVPQLAEKGRQVLEERLLFRLAVGAAREHLFLTFPRIESATAREQVPSYFLLRILDAHDRAAMPTAAAQPSPSDEPASVSLPVPVASRKGRGRARTHGQLAFSFADPDESSPSTLSQSASASSQSRESLLHLPTSAGGEGQGEGAVARGAASEKPLTPTLSPLTGRGRSVDSNAPTESSRHTLDYLGEPATYETLARWPGLRRIPLSPLAADPTRAATPFDYDLGHASRAMHQQPATLAAFAAISPHFGRAVRAEFVRWSTPRFTRHDGCVEDPELLDALRLRSPLRAPISPSRIEDYARCPFRFYMHNLLRLEELEEPETLIRSDPIAKGHMVHGILAEFLTKMRDQNRLPLDESSLADLLEIAGIHLAEFEATGACGPSLSWRYEREQLERFFREFVAREAVEQRQTGRLPAYFETAFGRGEPNDRLSNEPPKLELGDGRTIQFHGFIDRVDLAASTIYVIDYKGKKLPKLGKDGTSLGRAIQLPIYLLGAQAMLRPQGDFERGGGCYISYEPGVKPVDLPTPGASSDARLRDVLRTIADGIDAGLFMQYTAQDACAFCPYDRVCMGVQDAVTRLKRSDPAAQAFLEIKTDGFKLSADVEEGETDRDAER
jgi:RecB family exonuclease